MVENIQQAQEATIGFYRQMSAEQYDAIYTGSSDEFKASATREKLVGILKRVNQEAGFCSTATLVLTSYHMGGVVDLTYTRKCTKIGEVTEKFSWRIVNRKARLNSYFVTNPAFSAQ